MYFLITYFFCKFLVRNLLLDPSILLNTLCYKNQFF